MAQFIRITGDARTPLLHAPEIFKQYLKQVWFKELIGKRGSGKPIIADSSEIKGKNAGDTARYHFIPQYFGPGIEGQNASFEGNEKTLEEFYMDICVDQVGQAFKTRGKMTKKRTMWDIHNEFKSQITNWFRDRTERDIVSALTGYTTDGVTKLTGTAKDTTDLVNGDGRCFRPDYANSKFSTVEVAGASTSNNDLLSAMNSQDIINTELLDNLQYLAKNAGTYPMKPFRLSDGQEYYLLVIHPKVAVQLRQDSEWRKRMLNAYMGNKSLENDPIAKGALGIWEKILIKEAEYVETISNDSVKIARNLLLGSDAAVMGYAQTMDFQEEWGDYRHWYGVAADEIRGFKKLTFNGIDLNCAQVPTAI